MDTKTENSKAKLQEVARYRVISEKRALHIVQSLVLADKPIEAEILIQVAKFLDVNYYSDVIVERSINNICGYPLCTNELPMVPKQKYHICSKTNQVFDITERKYFCSNFCFKASNYYKSQLSSSPLWLQKEVQEKDITLLVPESLPVKSDVDSSCVISKTHYLSDAWEESDMLNKKVVVENESKYPEKENDSRKSKLTSQHEENQNNDKIFKKVSSFNLEHLAIAIDEVEMKNDDKKSQTEQILSRDCNTTSQQGTQQEISHIAEQITEYLSTSVNKIPKRKTTKNKNSKQLTHLPPSPFLSLLNHVKQSLSQWITWESVELILNENEIKNLLKCKQVENEDSSSSKFNLEYQESYQRLCQKIDIQEALEFSDSVYYSQEELTRKPLPDYKKLKQETSQMELKVQEYFKGNFYEVKPCEETHTREILVVPQKVTSEDESAALPLLDSISQSAIRRRIVLDSLQKVIPTLVLPMGLNDKEVMSSIRKLVLTFSLSSHNITFKPVQWTLVSVILLNMLSLKNEEMKLALMKFSILSIFGGKLNLSPKDINDIIQEMIHSVIEKS